MSNDNLKVSIEASDGRAMRSYLHDGKTFVESHQDRVYQIRVKNQTSNRIKAVISVDSLNIVSGKPASNDPSETGYILGPYEEQVFKGYRVDDDTIAQFTFVKREKSYATEVGSGTGNGVIAVRAYQEKESESERQLKKLKQRIKDLEDRPREKEYVPYYPWHPYRPYRPYWERPYFGDTVWAQSTCGGVAFGDGNVTSSEVKCGSSSILRGASFSTTMAMSAQSTVHEGTPCVDESPFSMGSAWGDAIKDSVKMVEFEVGKLIGEVTIYYASLDGLKALGVNIERVKSVAFPEPFKRDYCAKPSGWKG